MTGPLEDFRIAVGFSVTLSGQLVQAAVTLLTVQGAYVAYVLTSRETKPPFELFAILAFLVFILSIYFSGKGVTAARNAGFAGKWSLDAGKSYFNAQASLLVVGVALLAAMIFFSGSSKDSDMARKLAEISQANALLNSKIVALSLRVEEVRAADAQSLSILESEVHALHDSVATVGLKDRAKQSRGTPIVPSSGPTHGGPLK